MALRASIYTSSGEIAELSAAVDNLIGALGYEVIEKLPPEKGSWFRRMRLRTASYEQKKERLASLKNELSLVARLEAQTDALKSSALGDVVAALEGIDDAVIQIGSVLLVKHQGNIIARTLSEEELNFLSEHPELLKSPQNIIERLALRE